MFGTLVLHLPIEAGYEGGALVVKHNGMSKTFDSSEITSTDFAYIIFFLLIVSMSSKIPQLARLCLTFNLVRCNTSSNEVLASRKAKEIFF